MSWVIQIRFPFSFLNPKGQISCETFFWLRLQSLFQEYIEFVFQRHIHFTLFVLFNFISLKNKNCFEVIIMLFFIKRKLPFFQIEMEMKPTKILLERTMSAPASVPPQVVFKGPLLVTTYQCFYRSTPASVLQQVFTLKYPCQCSATGILKSSPSGDNLPVFSLKYPCQCSPTGIFKCSPSGDNLPVLLLEYPCQCPSTGIFKKFSCW